MFRSSPPCALSPHRRVRRRNRDGRMGLRRPSVSARGSGGVGPGSLFRRRRPSPPIPMPRRTAPGPANCSMAAPRDWPLPRSRDDTARASQPPAPMTSRVCAAGAVLEPFMRRRRTGPRYGGTRNCPPQSIPGPSCAPRTAASSSTVSPGPSPTTAGDTRTGSFALVLTLLDTPTAGSSGLIDLAMPKIVKTGCGHA